MSERIICPICGKEYKYLNNFHLKTHGYLSEKDFHKDYPDFPLKTSEVSHHISAHMQSLNSDSELQSSKGKQGWTEERRKLKSKEMYKVLELINSSEDFEEFRLQRLKGWSYGKRHTYTTLDNRVLTLRSFLECRVAKFLELNSYQFEYETVEVEYINPTDSKSHKYYPDFYLPQYNLIIEVKPSDRIDESVVISKRQATENCGYNYMFVTEKDLTEYRTLVTKINALRIE